MKKKLTKYSRCLLKNYGYSRLILERIVTPIDLASYKWTMEYKKRSSVERVNSRLDEFFGFEKHYLRGEVK